MAGFAVLVDAAKTHRSLVASAPARRRAMPLPQLLFWRRMIDSAVADAKRVTHGIPTDAAIAARWWLEELRPPQSECREWERSFECCCSWLHIEPNAERMRLLAAIDADLMQSYLTHLRAVMYQRRAAVLTCAGLRTAIQRQYVLPLVSVADYEHVAGIEHGDPVGAVRIMKQRKPLADLTA